MIGASLMIWQDTDNAKPPNKKISEGVSYFKNKYGASPNICFVNEALLNVFGIDDAVDFRIDGALVRSRREMWSANIFYIGCEIPKIDP